MQNNWLRQPRTWVEIFALFNLGGLAPDIFLAHSTNQFHSGAEWIPLIFSLAAPAMLLPAIWALAKEKMSLWRALGNITGWISVSIGIVGLVLHLKSQFFQQWTLASLVYAAPFAAPLAYTGIGLLLILNRTVAANTREWAEWVIFLALGGFMGNFIFSVTDHAQNGFFRQIEWIPVITSALAVGFLTVPLITRVNHDYFNICFALLMLQIIIGLAGFALHLQADLHAAGPNLFEKVVHGAPIFAPLLFPNLALLAGIGIWTFQSNCSGGKNHPGL
jgi:hypothetical protein